MNATFRSEGPVACVPGSDKTFLAQAYAPIADDLLIAESIFDEELQSDLPFVETLCDRVRSYHGKMLRPALLLLTARATGEISRRHHTLAAVVEMVHMATLVHDDVLDGADERRSKPTVAALSGNTVAVLLGDYLISHAFHLCSSLQDPYASRRIGAATNTVCEGEMLQNHRGGDMRISQRDYIDIISRKTGALTAVSCELGAYYSDADAALVEAMDHFGMSAGTAFQIVDDVLDIVGESDAMGKTLGRDVELGKLTLPLIHCLGRGDSQASRGIRAALNNGRIADRREIADWLNTTGSIDYAMDAAREYVATALEKLSLLPDSAARGSLAALTEFILSRRV